MSTDRARSLRRSQTEAEAKLWRALRGRGLGRAKFRRQVPIGPYYADFANHEAKLVVELDGSQHADQLAYDEARTVRMQEDGYRVLRFWNIDVLTNVDGVCDVIAAALEERAPSPARRGH